MAFTLFLFLWDAIHVWIECQDKIQIMVSLSFPGNIVKENAWEGETIFWYRTGKPLLNVLTLGRNLFLYCHRPKETFMLRLSTGPDRSSILCTMVDHSFRFTVGRPGARE